MRKTAVGKFDARVFGQKTVVGGRELQRRKVGCGDKIIAGGRSRGAEIIKIGRQIGRRVRRDDGKSGKIVGI